MRWCVLICALASVTPLASAQEPVQMTEQGSEVDRGRYLVESVAMCIQCHSPRDARGQLIRTERLTGGAVPVQPPPFAGEWALRAPRIAGLPGYTDEAALGLLMTGIGRDGRPLKWPMPPFRMTESDARAVVAYLRSLSGGGSPD